MTEIETQIQELFRGVLKRQDFKLSRELTTFDVDGWDSLMHMQLLAQIEKKYNLRFQLKDVMRMKNIGDLVDSVTKQMEPPA